MTTSAFGVVSSNTLTGSAATSPPYVIGYTRWVNHTTVVWAPLGDPGVCESGDVGGVQLLVLNGGAPAQGAVASLPVVEDLHVLKMALASSMRVVHR